MKQKYRKGVGIFLINKRNQLWVGKRFDYKNEYWQMPQGGIDEPESPENAMKRELMEETGLNKNYKIISKTGSWLEYKLPQELVNEVWNGKYIGQKQIWFACRFFGNDDQVDIKKFKNIKDIYEKLGSIAKKENMNLGELSLNWILNLKQINGIVNLISHPNVKDKINILPIQLICSKN